MKNLFFALFPAVLALFPQPAGAEPTDIVVHVLAKGAKFVGSSMGGAEVTLTDAETGEVLAQGITEGGTGSTPNIMTTPHLPGDVLSDAGAAEFRTTLDIDRPRKITARVTGPMEPSDAAMTVSSTQWVLPGKHISKGDAWLLELRGFAIAVAEIPTELPLSGGPRRIPLTAKVTMMCGCPLEPGGMWDADNVEIAAVVTRDGERGAQIPLTYAGEPSTFEGEIELTEAGDYVVEVYAYDASNGNTGLRRFTLRVR